MWKSGFESQISFGLDFDVDGGLRSPNTVLCLLLYIQRRDVVILVMLRLMVLCLGVSSVIPDCTSSSSSSSSCAFIGSCQTRLTQSMRIKQS